MIIKVLRLIQSPARNFSRVARIQEISRLSPAQQELAERFAYGIFVLRPLPLTTVAVEYHKSYERSSSEARINIQSKAEWYKASDLRALADWMAHPRQPDFLIPHPEQQNAPLL